jgi:hypothetical protein
MQSEAFRVLSLFILLISSSLGADCTRMKMPLDSSFEPSDAVWDNIRQAYSIINITIEFRPQKYLVVSKFILYFSRN